MNTATNVFSILVLGLCCLGLFACGSSSDDDDGGSSSTSAFGSADVGDAQPGEIAGAETGEASITLAGTSWQILSVMRGSGTLSPSDGQDLIINFGSDGVVSGSSGCNNFSGGYNQSGDSVSIGGLSSTLVGCDGERALIESAILSSLSVNGTISRVDDQLAVLRSSDGSIQLRRR